MTTASAAPAASTPALLAPREFELAEKVVRFGRIAEQADGFQQRIGRRLGWRAMFRVWFSNEPAWRGLRQSMVRGVDLFQMETPPEMVTLLQGEMTAEERKSPFAAITTARFSMPELARYTIRELALDLEELEAIESLIETRRQRFVDSSGRTFFAFALAALSLLSGDIPDEVIEHWGITAAGFKVPAFYVGCGLVAFALYLMGVGFLMTGRAEKQARVSSRLLVYCRAELKARGAGV